MHYIPIYPCKLHCYYCVIPNLIIWFLLTWLKMSMDAFNFFSGWIRKFMTGSMNSLQYSMREQVSLIMFRQSMWCHVIILLHRRITWIFLQVWEKSLVSPRKFELVCINSHVDTFLYEFVILILYYTNVYKAIIMFYCQKLIQKLTLRVNWILIQKVTLRVNWMKVQLRNHLNHYSKKW